MRTLQINAMYIMLALVATAFAGEAVAAEGRIPLVAGTVYTSASAFPAGDEEHVATLTALDAKTATFSVEFRALDNPGAQSLVALRRVRRQDLIDSHRINHVFQSGDPDQFPASTFMHLSAAALGELKTKGETAMVLGTINDFQGIGNASLFTSILSGRKYFRGTLKRVGKGTVSIPVLVNGERVLLPAIETAGQFNVGGDSLDAKFWWLDDPDNSLMLRSEKGTSSGQIVRIDLPASLPQSAVLARDLSAGECRANLSGIYFDTASARLLPQSGTALATVAKLLSDNAAWNLSIEGHTDNVGKADYNLDLSHRRADAVRKALTSAYAVAANRLTATGFGVTRPIASNATLDGRATNRRVEVARVCP